MLDVKNLTVEYQNAPIGVDAPSPRFAWKLESNHQNLRQTAYQIVVTKIADTVWDSGVQEQDCSIAVPYEGEALEPLTEYTVTITAADSYGEKATAQTVFRTGLLSPENMSAKWITHCYEDDLAAAAIFTKTFSVEKTARAYVEVSALGIYELRLNGDRVGDAFLTPGWTNYKSRIQYQTYPVTLHPGENIIEITVANGWYKGILGFSGQGNHYGKRTAVIAQVEIGGHTLVCTDESWQCSTGAVQYSDIYNGEIIDKTFVPNTSGWAKQYDQSINVLVAQQDEPVRITHRFPVKEVLHTPDGRTVLDFGQNLAGIVEARLHYPQGTRVTLRHGEALDENGNLYTSNLRTARATDTFICSGEEDVFLPSFTYHGFRYVSVEGLPGEPAPEDFTACVLHADLKPGGTFSCDNTLVNQLWHNINWTMRSNFLDVPTDCPQRDERFGYTGDAQLFLPTAVCLEQVPLFFEKWLRDLKTEQAPDGGIPTAVPNILGPSSGIANWQDAGIIVPWILWQTYGDLRFLSDAYDSMTACAKYIQKQAGSDGLLLSGQQLGDWIALDAERGVLCKYRAEVLNLSTGEKAGATDVYYVANMAHLRSFGIMAETATLLNKPVAAKEWKSQYDALRKAIRAEYLTSTGRLISDTQTGYALALWYGLADTERERQRLLSCLLDNLQRHNGHLTTGFIGTPILSRVLSANGVHEVAGKLLLKEDCPSWLYSVKLGATTVWELWDGVNEDGSFNKYEMNSLNQYTLASVGEWMLRDLGGLQLLSPGGKRTRIAPRLIVGISALSCGLETPYGTLSCSITCKDGQYTADITIPANTSALVHLPEQEEKELGSGNYHFVYATESCFEKQKYDMDTTFGELMEHPVAAALLEQYAAELMHNDMFLQFARPERMEALCAMLPSDVNGLFQMILQQCNAAEKGVAQ